MPHLSRMTSGPPVLPPVPEIDYELSFDQYGSIRSSSPRRRHSAIYAPKPVKAFNSASFLQHPPPPPPRPEDVPEDFSDEEGESEEEHPSTGGVLHSTLQDYCSPTSTAHSRSPCSPNSAHSIARSPNRPMSFAEPACQITAPLRLSKRTPTPESVLAITDLIASSSHYRDAPFNVPRSPSPTLASEEVLPVFMRSIVRRQMVEGPLPAAVEEAVDKELERLKAKALRGVEGAQVISPRISDGVPTIESPLKSNAALRTPTTEAKGGPDCVCKHCHKHGTPPLSAKPPAFALGALPPTPQGKQQPHIAAISIRRPASDEPRPSPTLASPRPVSEQLSKENIVLPVPEHPYASRSAQQHIPLHSPVEQHLALKSPIKLASEPAPASPVSFAAAPLSAAPLSAASLSPKLNSPIAFVSSPTVNAYGIVTPYTLPGKPPKRPPRPAESLHIPSRPQTPQHTHVIVALPESSRKGKEHVRRTSEPDSASSLGSFKEAIMDRTKTLAKQHTRKQSHEDPVPPTTNSKAIAILGGGSAANRRSTDATSPSVSSASSKTSFFSRKSSVSDFSPQIKSSKAAALLGIGAPEPPKRRFWEGTKKTDIDDETDRYYSRGGSLARVGRRTQPTGWSGAEGVTDRTSHYERDPTPETDSSDDEIYLSSTPPPPASTGVTTTQTVRIEPGPGDRFAPLSATIDIPEDVDPDSALAERTRDKGKAKLETPILFALEPLESHPFRPKQLKPKIRQEPQPSPVPPTPAATPVEASDRPLSPGSADEPPPRSSSFAASEIIAAIPSSSKSARSDEPPRAPKVDKAQAVRREEDALYAMAIPISALKRSEGSSKLRPAPITVEHVPPKRPYPEVVQEEALFPLTVSKATTPPSPPSPSPKVEPGREVADAPISALTAAVPATAVPPSADLPPLPPPPPPPVPQEEQVPPPKRRLKSEIISKFRMIDPPVELPSSSQPAQPSIPDETCTDATDATDATGYTDATATSTDCSTPAGSTLDSASSPSTSSTSTSTSTSTSSSSCDSFGTVTGSPVSPGATAANATRVTLDSSRASYVDNHKIAANVVRNNAQPRLIIAERHIPDLSRRTQDLWEQIRDDDDADDESDSSSSSSDDEDDIMEPLPHLPPLEEAIRIHTPRPRAGSAASSSNAASPNNSLALPSSTNTSPSQAGTVPAPSTPSPSTLPRSDSQRSNSPWRYTPMFDKDGREIPNLTPSTAQVRARAEYNARMSMQQESWFEPATPSTPTMPSMGDKVKAKVGAGSRWIKGHVQTLSR